MPSDERLDTVVLVPFQPYSGHSIEPLYRQTIGGYNSGYIVRGYLEFAAFLGRDILFRGNNKPAFGPERELLELTKHRSLTAVTLATHLEQAGLRWRVIDPGQQEIRHWREALRKVKHLQPRSVGISTTYVLGGLWIRALIAAVREILPESKLILGGYYYASDVADFLSLDADVYCVGAGELRLQQIVQAIRDGSSLEDIPGLYLRRPNAPHSFTGRPELPRLDQLPAPDWSLATRIDPPVDLSRDLMELGLESQRGCVFKCDFCTYRTLSAPDFLSVDDCVERILRTKKISARGIVRLMDATATFPHERWEALLERLIEQGGSPHPLWIYARVSDIKDRTAALMAKAGIREVFIGQESGDQRILNLMHKGTNVSQVKPALQALHRHGLWAYFSFIHGFPGETTESIQNTRSLITQLNDWTPPGRPAVAWYNVNPFFIQDYAAVAEKTDSVKNDVHYLAFDKGGDTSTKRMSEECLATTIAASRVPHGPVALHILSILDVRSHGSNGPASGIMASANRYESHRWLKAVERGISIFMEHEVDGTPVNLDELKKLRETVLAAYPARPSPVQRVAARALHKTAAAMVGRIMTEWKEEEKAGVGPLTRLSLAGQALLDTGRLRDAVRTVRTGNYLSTKVMVPPTEEAKQVAMEMAAEAIAGARDTERIGRVVREANHAARRKALPLVP